MKRNLLLVLTALFAVGLMLVGCPDGGGGTTKEYTVTFDLQGNGDNFTQPVKEGKKVDRPTDPSHDDFDFGGWVTTAGGSVQYDFDKAVRDDFTIYAKWDRKPDVTYFTVTFNLQGKGTDITRDVASGKTVQRPTPNPVHADYDFDGWFTTADGNEAFDFENTPITEETSIYAQWTLKPGVNPELTPWAPPGFDPDDYPTAYVNFPLEELEADVYNITAWPPASEGGAYLEDNGDGTYTVGIKTIPGGFSFISFNSPDSEYLFRTGYYLAVKLPDTPDYKPIAAATIVNTKPGDVDANWGPSCLVNLASGSAIVDNTVYLAGDIAFSWEEAEHTGGPYKSIILELYWGAAEEEGYYEFTLNKLLIPAADDLTPPSVPDTAWMPGDQPTEPEGLTSFTEEDILDGFTLAETLGGDMTIEKITGTDTYKVRVKSRSEAGVLPPIPSRIYFTNTGNTFSDIFFSLDLPDTTGDNDVKLTQMTLLGATGADGQGESGGEWSSAQGYTAPDGSYMKGTVDTVVTTATANFTTAVIYLYLYLPEAATDEYYEFTLKALKVKEYTGSTELGAWTPDPITAPTGWKTFTPAISSSYPAGATIQPKTGGGFTVTAKTRADGQTEITFKDIDFEGGYYLSLDLPPQTAESTMKPNQIVTNAPPGWDMELIITQSFKWLEGRVDSKYEGDSDKRETMVLSIYWHDDVAANQDYVFTINSFMVKEEYDDSNASDPEAWSPSTKDTPQPGMIDWTGDLTAVTGNWATTSVTSAEIGSSGTYEITITVGDFADPGNIPVTFTADSFDAVFVSVTLPESDSIFPTGFMVTTTDGSWGSQTWNSADSFPGADKYMAGDFDILLEPDDPSDKVSLYINGLAANDVYKFTLNALKVTSD